jgi:hypothetical protein
VAFYFIEKSSHTANIKQRALGIVFELNKFAAHNGFIDFKINFFSNLQKTV